MQGRCPVATAAVRPAQGWWLNSIEGSFPKRNLPSPCSAPSCYGCEGGVTAYGEQLEIAMV